MRGRLPIVVLSSLVVVVGCNYRKTTTEDVVPNIEVPPTYSEGNAVSTSGPWQAALAWCRLIGRMAGNVAAAGRIRRAQSSWNRHGPSFNKLP